MKVISMDPGGTTGYAFQNGPDMAFGQVEPEKVWITLEVYEPDVVVCERFTWRPMRAADLTAVEVIGVIKEWCRQRDRPLHLQTPEQAKHFFTDARLRGLALYQRGLPHANDAIRHLLYFRQFGAGKVLVKSPEDAPLASQSPENGDGD